MTFITIGKSHKYLSHVLVHLLSAKMRGRRKRLHDEMSAMDSCCQTAPPDAQVKVYTGTTCSLDVCNLYVVISRMYYSLQNKMLIFD